MKLPGRITRIPALFWFVGIVVRVSALSLVGLLKSGVDITWAGAAQIVVLFATVVMLVVVWVQLAVQTVVAILGTAQDETIRLARERLYDAEETHGISKLCSSHLSRSDNKWDKAWKDDADRVSQSWNTVGYLLQRDVVANLLRKYIAKTRRAILKTRYIVQPRIAERRAVSRGGQPDLWDDFDWLAMKAIGYLRQGEIHAWRLPDDFSTRLRPSSLTDPCTSRVPEAQSGPQHPAQLLPTAAG
jgi:hypothetical protein